MGEESVASPDSTVVRVALWRALHLEVDAPPAVFRGEVGLRLSGPEDEWLERRTWRRSRGPSGLPSWRGRGSSRIALRGRRAH